MRQTNQAPGDGLAPLGEVLGFMRLLWAVAHGLESTSKRMRSTLGVTAPQRLVLRIVGQNPGISPGELADVLHVDPSSLTGVLRRLETTKLLARKRDARDRRRAVLTVTASGRKLNAQRAGTVEAAVARTLSAVTRAERRSAESLLEMLARELEG